jgi:cytochrome oxidase assembly protein ShyY1
MKPEHDYSKRPLQLFWLDGLALQAIAESDEETMLMAQVLEEQENDDQDGSQIHTGANKLGSDVVYPLQPPLSSIGNFKTTPSIHAGYAATWFGLSAAGVYMTRKLITKGRF